MAVITLKEISKFSVDIFRTSLLDRRQFLTLLLTGNYFQTPLMAEAINRLKEDDRINHFYWLDLKSGAIHLPTKYIPAKHIIDAGQPGSLMKLIAAAAILQENLSFATKIIDCRGTIVVTGKHYICRYPHGRLSLVEAIGQSCNVFFAQTAKELSADCFLHYLAEFGLSQAIDFSGSRCPNTADLVLGLAKQYKMNAIQILQLVSLIANKGKPMPFHYNYNQTDLQKSKISKKPKIPNAKVPANNILTHDNFISGPTLSEHTWNILQTGMQIACQRGTAKNLDPQNKLHLAVKTGTTSYGRTFQSWLAGYFPYESPSYSFCLRSNQGTSYDRAVPAASKYLFARDWT